MTKGTTIYPDPTFRIAVKNFSNSLDNGYRSASDVYIEGAKQILEGSITLRAKNIIGSYHKFLNKKYSDQLCLDDNNSNYSIEQLEEKFELFFNFFMNHLNKEIPYFESWLNDHNQ